MRIALVHDYLIQYGGAERVLEEFLEMYPKAPLFTLLYNPQKLPRNFQKKLERRKIITSTLQKFPFSCSRHKFWLWAMPFFVEQWDFKGFNFVLSDTTSFAKGIICPPGTRHICYCHTPLRYGWDLTHHYQKEYPYPWLVKKIMAPFLLYLRIWDRAAAQRPDVILCNSSFIQKRIKKYYQRQAEIVHPPCSIFESEISSNPPNNYFLIISRLIPYKKVDLAIEAFNKLGWPLIIIGDGPERKYLQKKAKSNIKFLGAVYGSKLKKIIKHCKAFLMPQEEDFGIAACEAMACGRPVIAYKGGGALDYIKQGVNGIFFDKQTPESLEQATERFRLEKFNSYNVRESVKKFDKSIFRSKIKKVIEAD